MKMKTMVQLSLQRALKQRSILIYLYLDSMAIEDTRPECYWHVIKVAPGFQNEINTIVTYNVWRKHRRIVTDSK